MVSIILYWNRLIRISMSYFIPISTELQLRVFDLWSVSASFRLSGHHFLLTCSSKGNFPRKGSAQKRLNIIFKIGISRATEVVTYVPKHAEIFGDVMMWWRHHSDFVCSCYFPWHQFWWRHIWWHHFQWHHFRWRHFQSLPACKKHAIISAWLGT